MIEVVESSVPEVLSEDSIETVIESVASASVVETTSSGPDILAETVTSEIITDIQAQTVVATEIDTYILETAEQGPPGPAGPSGSADAYPGKTLVYSGGVLTEVLLYSDAAKTTLAQRRVLNRTGATLNSVTYYNGAGTLTKTRTFNYTGADLTSVVET